LSIVGNSGYGKTSLLINFEALAKEYCDVDTLSSTRIVYLDLQEPYVRTPRAIFSTLCKSVDPASDVETTSSGSVFEFYHILRRVIRKSQSRIVVMMDEVETALKNPTDFSPQFWSTLRSIATNFGVAFVLASELPLLDYWHQLEHLRNDIGSPFYGIFRVLKVNRFDDREVGGFFELSDVPFNEQEKSWINEFADGNPLKMQVACHIVYELKPQLSHQLTKSEFKESLSEAARMFQADDTHEISYNL